MFEIWGLILGGANYRNSVTVFLVIFSSLNLVHMTNSRQAAMSFLTHFLIVFNKRKLILL